MNSNRGFKSRADQMPKFKTFDTDVISLIKAQKLALLYRINTSGDPRQASEERDLLKRVNNYLAQSDGCTLAEWCDTMERPKAKCGCPDCGSSILHYQE